MKTVNRVTLVATVLNERRSVEQWAKGIDGQTLVPHEIVIVDGGSTDGTLEWLHSWDAPCCIRLIRAQGVNIARGRNLAIAEASGDIVAITDLGTIASPDWLERLVHPFQDERVDVVSGFFVPLVSSKWERALAAATLPEAGEIQADKFLPSSRSVAIRAAWCRSGFSYPEWLDYCEDLIWDLQLKNAGARFFLAKEAVVAFEVRQSVHAFFKQYYRYARGDGKAGLFGKRHAVRYTTYLAAIAIVVRRNRGELLIAGGLGTLYVSRSLRRLAVRDRRSGKGIRATARVAWMLPLIIAVGDVAKMMGYPAGIVWRVRRFGPRSILRGWRRVTPSGEVWRPGAPGADPLPQAD